MDSRHRSALSASGALDEHHPVFGALLELAMLGPQLHLVVRGAGRDHRKDVLLLVDEDVGDHRARRLDHRLDHAVHLLGPARPEPGRPEGLRELHEIGQRIHVALGIAPAVEELLPLAHHAHIFVVEQEGLHRQPVLHHGRQLLDHHEERRLARDIDDQRIGMGHLHAHRRRKAVAHGAEAARGHPAVGLVELEELGRPHLVLAHLGGEVGVPLPGRLIEPLQRVLRLDGAAGALVAQAVAPAPCLDPAPPGRQRLAIGRGAARLPRGVEGVEREAGVADDGHVHRHVLVDGRGVDVDLHLGRAAREIGEPAGHAVVEARAHGDHQIALGHRHVGLVGAVHPEHPEEQVVGPRIAAEPHQRVGDGVAGAPHQRRQARRRLRPGVDDAAAGVEERAPGRGQQFDRALDRVRVGLAPGPVGGMRHAVARRRAVAIAGDIGRPGHDHVLGQVHDHGAGPAGGRDVIGLADRPAESVDLLHQIVVLGAGPGDADRVGFLEGVVADHVGRHLPGQADHRDAVHERVGEPGDAVGGAGARGDQHRAHLAGGARIALGRVDGALLVPHQDVAQLVLLEDGVVDRQDRAAGIAEHHVHAEIDQSADDQLGPGRLCRSVRLGIRCHDDLPPVRERRRPSLAGESAGPRQCALARTRVGGRRVVPHPMPVNSRRSMRASDSRFDSVL